MIPLTGAALGIVILLFIAFANITTISVQAYQVCVAMRQEGVKFLLTMRWDVLVTIFLGLAVFLLIKPSLIYDNFFQFLYWIGLGYAPPIGIVCVDYFVFRRQKLDLYALFDARKGSRTISGGLEHRRLHRVRGRRRHLRGAPQPGLALVLGVFPYTSATFASMVVAMVVYSRLTLLGEAVGRAATRPDHGCGDGGISREGESLR